MSRQITYRQKGNGSVFQGSSVDGLKEDGYSEKLLKYIPAEILTLYVTLDSVAKSASDFPTIMHWVIFILGLIATYAYGNKILKIASVPQLCLSTVAFFVWTLSIGGPFEIIGTPEWVGAMILPIFTFTIPFFNLPNPN